MDLQENVEEKRKRDSGKTGNVRNEGKSRVEHDDETEEGRVHKRFQKEEVKFWNAKGKSVIRRMQDENKR